MQKKHLEEALFADEEAMIKIKAEGPFYNKVWELCNIKEGEKILEVGCGTGVYGIQMAKLGGDVIGIDIAEKAITFANQWAKEETVRFKGVVGDAEKLPFEDETFDIVFFGAVLHHFPDCFSVIAEAARVLKKGGRIVLVEPNGNNPVARVSRFFARMLDEKYAADIHATKNETIHTPNTYTSQLKQVGFTKFRKIFYRKKPGHKKNFTKNVFLRGAIFLKAIAMNLIGFTIPSIGSEGFLLKATKDR